MPIRFQVDGDFYDHPKTIGMSDAAFSLWVRAGSFSAAKTTDGLIEDDVLVHTLRSSTDVADELVRRRLWRRVKGGYKFHQWENRNLTKKRVEEDREADRERKRLKRLAELKAAGQSTKPQAEPRNVRPESKRNPEGIPPDSEGIPDRSVSVSVSVSESVSGSGRDAVPGQPPTGEPPPRCPKHLQDPDPPPCGPCADARRANETWTAQETERRRQLDLLARSTAAKERAAAERLAIDACHRCDSDGKIGGRPCPHTDPPARPRRPGLVGALTRERADPVARARQRAEPSPIDAALDALPPPAQPPPADDEPETLAEVVPIRPTTTEAGTNAQG